jgi:hypothetical protein
MSNATKQTRKIVSAKVWKKYNKVKTRRFGVDSSVDNELVDKKLQILNEVGKASWSSDKLFWASFFFYALRPCNFSTHFLDISALNERSQFGKTVVVYIIVKLKKNRQIFGLPLRSHSKTPQV